MWLCYYNSADEHLVTLALQQGAWCWFQLQAEHQTPTRVVGRSHHRPCIIQIKHEAHMKLSVFAAVACSGKTGEHLSVLFLHWDAPQNVLWAGDEPLQSG